LTAGTDSPRRSIFDWFAAATVVALLIVDLVIERGTSTGLYVAGTVALLCSIAFFVPPFYLLKKHGEVERGRSYFETNTVVDRGVYGIVRHPQYLGYILLLLGFTLRCQRISATLLGVIGVLLFYLQAVWEERFCVEQLGAKYEAYQKKVPRFNFALGVVRYLKRQVAGSTWSR
jgi:protein-S-isoprenylcysteine O-methyltransferase Ste14